MRLERKLRAGRALAAIAAIAALAACENMLNVTNPAAISPGNLDDPAMTATLANSATGEFNRMYPQNAYWGAILGDEAVTGHNYTQYHDFDLRIVDENNFNLPDVYVPVQRARSLAEDVVAHLRTTLADSASRNASFAIALVYAGYSNLVLAETFCSAPVDPKADALSSDDLMKRALTDFDEAITVAAAAPKSTDMLYLARVGAGRAALWLGDNAKAISYATPVPATWKLWINQSQSKAYLNNPYWANLTGAGNNFNLGVDTTFRGLNDPRVRYKAARTGHDQRTMLAAPYMAESFGTWSADAQQDWAVDTRVLLASGLEARYIVAQAGGYSPSDLLSFVNERRAVGKQTALTTTDVTALQAEVRDQRRRDFFLDGHRLGDLRRYKAKLGIDMFPAGPYVNPFYGANYGTATCFVPTHNEWIGFPRV